MCERLVRKGLVRRTRTPNDRRVVRLRLTTAGESMVDQVISRRRDELSAIVAATSDHWRPAVTAALHAFAKAAGEIPEQEWWLGWAETESGEIAV